MWVLNREQRGNKKKCVLRNRLKKKKADTYQQFPKMNEVFVLLRVNRLSLSQ